MSFKRDGNDPGLLSTLRNRRIKDLLAEDIPEDEAKLLSNGRFTCLVCSHHPVFDTVHMLCVHRRGKKHKANAEYHEHQKEDLRQLVAKRKHDQYLLTGSTHIISTPGLKHGGLSTCGPYDSRVKKPKTKPGDRKTRLNLKCDEGDGKALHLPEERIPHQPATLWQKICDQQQHGPVRHDSQLKNIAHDKEYKPLTLTPYKSKHARASFEVTNGDFSYSSVKALGSKKCVQKNTCDSLDQCSRTSHEMNFSIQPSTSSEALSAHHFSKSKLPVQTLPLLPPPPPQSSLPASPSLSSSQLSSKYEKVASDSLPQTQGSQQTPQKASLAQKYHQLQGSGWKKDWDGKWIKDNDAEFDSDEEPPDLP